MSDTRLAANAAVDNQGKSGSLGLLDRLQPVLLLSSIAIGLGLAQLAADFAESLSPLVSVGVFVLIYLVMLGVDFGGIAKALGNRKFLAAAIVINFVVNPLLAWGLGALFLRSEPDLWIGLVLFLVTPCIGWYLIFTELAGGDARLGVGLLGINVALQILLLPVYLYVFVGQSMTTDLNTIAMSVLSFLIAPLGLASITRWVVDLGSDSTRTVQQLLPLGYIKAGALVVVIVAMFASQADALFENSDIFTKLVAPITAFFVLAFLLAIGVGRRLDLPYEQTALLVFTTTSRNSEASLAIAATAFTSPLVALTVVIGPVIELPLLIVMVRVLLKRSHPETQSP